MSGVFYEYWGFFVVLKLGDCSFFFVYKRLWNGVFRVVIFGNEVEGEGEIVYCVV